MSGVLPMHGEDEEQEATPHAFDVMKAKVKEIEKSLSERIKDLENRVRELEERLSKLEK